MTIELLGRDLPVEQSVEDVTTQRGPRLGRALVCQLTAAVALIAVFAAMFLAVQWCLETGLQMITQQIAEHLRGSRGF